MVMIITSPTEIARQKNKANIALGLAIYFLFCTGLLFAFEKDGWILLFVAIAICLGNYAFNCYDKLALLVPPPSIRHETQCYGAKLKNGSEVNVSLAFHYPSEDDSPHALTRIEVQLQRTLNMYLSQIEALSSDPYNEIDKVLREELKPLRAELGLRSLALNVVEVTIAKSSAAPTTPPGINLRTL